MEMSDLVLFPEHFIVFHLASFIEISRINVYYRPKAAILDFNVNLFGFQFC